MRVYAAVLALCLYFVYVAAVPKVSHRIAGGFETSVEHYPAIATLLFTHDSSTYVQGCGGVILTIRSILTAATCTYGDATRLRVRVGSSYASSGGSVHNVGLSITHFNYDPWNHESDLSIIQLATFITYVDNAVEPARIAGTNYIPADNDEVWAAGWGSSYSGGPPSERLRHVQLWTINQADCRSRYTSLGWPVSDNMLCSGYPGEGGRDQCDGDYGSPLYHNTVVVGVYSWGYHCGIAEYPAVNTRISSFTVWIQENA